MRILLTNDDGVHAPGILAAKQALDPLGEVFLVAPDRPRSAAGHAITLHKPLRITPMKLSNGMRVYGTSGTPTDCVNLGYDILMEGRCDLVVSGINAGANLGWDLTYSGTVAGALEGAVLGIPALAISLVTDRERSEIEPDFSVAARYTALFAQKVLADPISKHTLLNINVPHVPESDLKGIAYTHQGRREYVDRIVVRDDPFGRPYYWQAGSIREDVPDEGSDVHAVLSNQISVTPVHLDMTAYSLLDQIQQWTI